MGRWGRGEGRKAVARMHTGRPQYHVPSWAGLENWEKGVSGLKERGLGEGRDTSFPCPAA